MALTLAKIARLNRRGRYRDGLVRGLCLQVGEGGKNKSWLLRYQRDGKDRYLGLGSLTIVDLPAARERARAAKLLLLDDIDPIEAKRAARVARKLAAAKSLTFKEVAEQYFEFHQSKWNNAKHRAQFFSTLKQYAYSYLGNVPVAEIDTPLVLKVLEQQIDGKPFWQARATANRVRGRIEAVLDYATVRKYRTGDNPGRWKSHLENVLPAQRTLAVHHAALPFAEIASFMTALRGQPGMAARALEFCVLTAARTGEVTGARWCEIDLTTKVWTVPADRIKGAREHRVPLSDAAVALLRALPREDDNPHVFIGPRQRELGHDALARVLQRMKRDDCTVHGFRSTFRDWAAEAATGGYPNHVIEMALAHAIGNKVEAAYRRGDLLDQRRRLMAEWARYCEHEPVVSDVVTPIRGSVS